MISNHFIERGNGKSVLFKKPVLSTDYDYLLENEGDFLIRMSSDNINYVITYKNADGTIKHIKGNAEGNFFSKDDLKEIMQRAIKTTIGADNYYLKQQIFPHTDQKASPGLTITDLLDGVLISNLEKLGVKLIIASTDLQKKKNTTGFLLKTLYRDIERIITVPPEEMVEDSNQKEQVKSEKNQKHDAFQSVSQCLKKIQEDDQEMQKVEHLVKIINDFMLKEIAETHMNLEQEQSLLALQSDILNKQLTQNSVYFIGRFSIDRSDLKSEIATAKKEFSIYYKERYSLNSIEAEKEAEQGAIKIYISKKLGISPVEIEVINKLAVKVFISGKAVSNYIAQYHHANSSVSGTMKRNV